MIDITKVTTNDQKIDEFVMTFKICIESLERNIRLWEDAKIFPADFIDGYELAKDNVTSILALIEDHRAEVLEFMNRV